MKTSCFFPAIDVTGDADTYKAIAAIRLASIQSVRLRSFESVDAITKNQPSPFQCHRSLLQAISGWPQSVSLSWNLLTHPDPASPLSGTIDIAILVMVSGDDREAVIAELISRHANLFSLLSSFLTESEFEVITQEEELEGWIHPFTPKHVFCIDRFRDSFTLTVEGEHGHTEQVPGFLSTSQKQEETTVVDYLFPWYQEGYHDLSTMVEALLFHPSPLWLQFRLRPGVISRNEINSLKKNLRICEELINGLHTKRSILSIQTKALLNAISERIWHQNHRAFTGGFFVASQSAIDESLVGSLADVISPAMGADQKHSLSLKGGSSVKSVEIQDFLNSDFVSTDSMVTIDEASCAFRVPCPDRIDPHGLSVKQFRTGLASPALLQRTPDDTLTLGENRHRGHITPIKVTSDDLMRHSIILGQTGTGKSVYMESHALANIRAGKGLCFIDPHGDSIEKLLNDFPEERASDLILIDFLDRDHVVPFNLLSWSTPEERDRVIDGLYGWLDMTYDMKKSGGPIFEQYFRSFLRLLMGHAPRVDFIPTITDFLRLFVNREFRQYCLEHNEDPQISRMVKQANAAGGDVSITNMAPYITSKLNRFELDHGLQLMTGQETMRINFQSAMNSNKVMLINLGRGRFGETVSGLLANQIVGNFQSAAMKRIDMRPEERKDFFLYVDEFQNVASDSFISMLSEARKFRLGLVLANQYADQLENKRTQGGDSVLKAILGNVGNITCFRLGINDAKTMAEVYHPHFKRDDLLNLPIGNCYVNLKTGRSNPSSFSMQTQYIKTKERPEYVEKLRSDSNSCYTISLARAQVNLEKHDQQIDELIAGA